METRAPTSRQLVIPIAFALMSVALALVIWLTFGGSLPAAPQGYRFAIVLPDASDLYPGSDVDISGVKIGHVIDIQRDQREARVLVELARQYAPVRTGATAIKRTKSLLGEGYIEIAPGPRSSKPIPDGGELAPSHVLAAQSLDEVLDTFAPVTRQKLRSLFGGLASAFAGRAPQSLSNSLGYAAPVTEKLDAVFGTLASQQHDLGRLFSGSADVLTALAGREAVLQAAVTAGDQVLGATARSDRGLSATIRGLPPFLTELRNASQTIEAATGDLNGAVTSLTPAAARLDPALQAIDASAPQFKGLFHDLPAVFAAGKRGLPAATNIVRTAGSALATIYPVTRQVIPLLQLLAALRDSLPSFFANIGSFLNGTVDGPVGLTHAAGAIPSIWNETLAGWKIRLPSNRPNPYPKPGAALEIAHGGLLSYDCRQLGNPDYFPPTGGTGAPPCRLQGPWTFNGKAAYYPRPTLASP